jgi:hypothetical protein
MLQTTSCNWIIIGRGRKWEKFTNVYVLCVEVELSIGATLDDGFRELRLQELGKRRCMIDRALPQPPAQTCRRAPLALFIQIGTSHVSNWQYSFQSGIEVQFIQHDNARPHTSLWTQEVIAKFRWTVLPHPPIVLIWCCQIFIFGGHWRIHRVGQGLEMTRALFVQRGRTYVNRKLAGTGKACISV